MKVSKEIYDLVQKHDQKEIKMGIAVEREHDVGDTDVVQSDLDVLKIALAHLEEDPEYYTHLKAMEDKYVKERDGMSIDVKKGMKPWTKKKKSRLASEEMVQEWILEEGTGTLKKKNFK